MPVEEALWKKRPRNPLPGRMLHQDGSTHEWVPGGQGDLIVTLDEATTELSCAFFEEEEGTMSRLQGVREVIGTKGPCSARSTDRGSHSGHTDEAGGKVDTIRLTHVYRALQQLGVTHIPASSPEARGRSERAFRTLQDRMAQRAGAGQQHGDGGGESVPPRAGPPPVERPTYGTSDRPGYRLHPVGRPANLTEILWVQEERVVAKDTTVHDHRQRLQIPQAPHRFHDVTVTVRVPEYLDGTLAVFHGPRCRARYDADGRLIETEAELRRRKDPTSRSGTHPIVDPRPTVCATISAPD